MSPHRLQSVWPDDVVKSSPMLNKSCPKSSHRRIDISHSPKKTDEDIRVTFVITFVKKAFQKYPNLVTLAVRFYVRTAYHLLLRCDVSNRKLFWPTARQDITRKNKPFAPQL